jgi:hypothetical protein
VDLTELVTKLFGPPEEVQDCDCHPSHLYRWTLFRKRALNVTVYHSDAHWSGHLQDCPRRFISVGVAKHAAGETLPDRVQWMVLIGKAARDVQQRKSA